jgi:hypothetical protein
MLNTRSAPSNPRQLSMDGLLMIAFGQAAFQYLNAGCSLGVFALLKSDPGITLGDLASRCGLSVQSARRLCFGLVSLGLIREHSSSYFNAPLIEQMFAQDEWEVFTDLIAFHGEIVYAGETDFVASLKTDRNVGLRRIPGNGPTLYHRLAEVPKLQAIFYRYMHSWSNHAIPLLLNQFDFSPYRRVADICGGDATNAIALARAFPTVETVTLVDLPGNASLALERIRDAGLESRITVHEADIFTQSFPRGHDCFLFIHVMVIWSLDVVTSLLKNACDALPAGGAVVIFSSISSDDGTGPLMAALDTAYFVSLPAGGGMIHAWKDYEDCLAKAGFGEVQRISCNSWTPHGIIIGIK